MIVDLDMQGRFLSELQLMAGLVPESPAISSDTWCRHAVHDHDAVWCEVLEHLGHDVLEPPSVPAYEDGVGSSAVCSDAVTADVGGEEVAHVDSDARSTVTTHVVVDDGFTLRTYLEGLYTKMRKQQASLDADTARTETDVP